MVLAGFMERFKGNRDKFKEAETDHKINQMVGQKQKSSNERELERFQEEARQERIKKQLENFRATQRRELFSGSLLQSKKLFDHSPTVLKEDKKVLDNNNMFMNQGNMF